MNKLPVIDSCDGCGACCMEQESPPGYVMLLSSPQMMENAELFSDDVERLKNLPAEAIAELKDHLAKLQAHEWPEDSVCIWLDRETKRCRYHEHRPMICREFEIGEEDCLGWRMQYDIS